MTTLNTNTLAQVQLQQVIEQLKQDDSTLLQAYSEYASTNNYDSVYDNDDDSVNMMFSDSHDALRSAFYGDYNPSHAYFTFNGYGNLQSFEYLDSDNSPIDIEELAQWISNNELYSDFDIEVTTLDDMLASIEDNITDDKDLLNNLVAYLRLSLYSEDEVLDDGNDWDEYRIEQCMDWLSTSYDYNELNNILTHLGINYE